MEHTYTFNQDKHTCVTLPLKNMLNKIMLIYIKSTFNMIVCAFQYTLVNIQVFQYKVKTVNVSSFNLPPGFMFKYWPILGNDLTKGLLITV